MPALECLISLITLNETADRCVIKIQLLCLYHHKWQKFPFCCSKSSLDRSAAVIWELYHVASDWKKQQVEFYIQNTDLALWQH